MKQTLFEIVEDIMSDLNLDEVNSISDTVESLQVANIVKSTYYDLITTKNWPHLRTLMTLNPSTDANRPTHMKVPENIKEVVSISYNVRKSTDTKDRYEEIKYLSPEAFLRNINKRDSSASNVKTVIDFSGVKLFIYTDKKPMYYTSFDDDYVVFDAYDSSVDSTLQGSKTQVIAYTIPSWTMDDNFVPDLPAEAFPALVSEAKSAASLRIKQVADNKAEQQSNRQRNWLSRKAWQVSGAIELPNYARRPKK